MESDDCEFLINATWEGNDAQCVNGIHFGEDFSFNNWCFCGSPVGAGDVTEQFRYRASDRSILLLDNEYNLIATGTILYVDDMYLVVDLWEGCYVYENVDIERPTPRNCALEYTGTEELSKPCLSILDYNDGMLTVSSYNYDNDAADNFEIWTFPASETISFSTVTVTIENGNETLEHTVLTEDDYEYIGEFYTSGYLEINYDGQVESVVFYGELIIEN